MWLVLSSIVFSMEMKHFNGYIVTDIPQTATLVINTLYPEFVEASLCLELFQLHIFFQSNVVHSSSH